MASRRKAAGDVALTWVKPAQQERSRDTHERIVAAAERLLARGRAWHEISVAELVAEADASIGSFYNRFRDKDTLLHVLQIELNTQGVATAQQAEAVGSGGVPLDAIVRAFVGVAVRAYTEQRGLRRALLVEMCTKPGYRERSAELTKLTCRGLALVLAKHVRTRDVERIAEVVDLCHRIVYGVLDQELLYDGDPPTGRRLSDTKLIEELTTVCLAYVAAKLPLRG